MQEKIEFSQYPFSRRFPLPDQLFPSPLPFQAFDLVLCALVGLHQGLVFAATCFPFVPLPFVLLFFPVLMGWVLPLPFFPLLSLPLVMSFGLVAFFFSPTPSGGDQTFFGPLPGRTWEGFPPEPLPPLALLVFVFPLLAGFALVDD